MDTLSMREIIGAHGPFASVYLPPEASWRTLRRQLVRQHVDKTILATLDDAVGHHDGQAAWALVTAADKVLVDECPSWSPPDPVARVSDLPYLLPLAHRHAAREPAADRSVFDQFVFELSRPGGLAVEGLKHCTQSLRENNADALVISVRQLGDRRVWVGGAQHDLVAADDSLRGQGVPIRSVRADEALPVAALTAGAEVIVTSEPDRPPLADGVGVLLRHP